MYDGFAITTLGDRTCLICLDCGSLVLPESHVVHQQRDADLLRLEQVRHG